MWRVSVLVSVIAIAVGCSEQGSDRCTTAMPRGLRDPNDLTCEAFGACTAMPFGPTWGLCGSACSALDETACAADDGCRVVRDARCAISGTCETDFLGCFPTDDDVQADVACLGADSETCSKSPACIAYHLTSDGCALDGGCGHAFVLCMPADVAPGRCFDPVTCSDDPPACASGTTPGVVDGCYTGACIPTGLCEQP